jgi:hypothetical protein
MAKKTRIKTRRKAERSKLEAAARFIERGGATGGGRIGTKKLRRSLEAHNIPMVQSLRKPAKSRKGRRREAS